MIQSVGKYTYGTDNYTTTVRRYYSTHDATQPTVTIGAFTGIGLGCRFFTGDGVAHQPKTFTNYPFGNTQREIFTNYKPPMVNTKGNIVVGNDVWIGESVTIMSGVTVGDGAVIAANSHVFKDVEPYSYVGGNPAKFIKYRFSQEIIKEMLELQWWNYPDPVINWLLPLLQEEPTVEKIQRIKQLLKENNL